jgi:hypothetical protein
MDQSNERESQVKIRIAPELRDWLKHQAIANRRTLSREIEYRVIESQKREQRSEGAAA